MVCSLLLRQFHLEVLTQRVLRARPAPAAQRTQSWAGRHSRGVTCSWQADPLASFAYCPTSAPNKSVVHGSTVQSGHGCDTATRTRVTIRDNRKASDSTDVINYFLQAVSPENASTGEWKVADKENCSDIDTAILNVTQQAANWTSSVSNISSVEIRAYIVFADRSAVFKAVTLNKAPETTTLPTSTTHNSVPVVQSSSFFIAVIQLPLLLVTSRLLS
nr:uncharacterized protein LOC110357579 isoform X1 [Columba livia]